MFCTQCGKRNDQAAKFCFACGEHIRKPESNKLDLKKHPEKSTLLTTSGEPSSDNNKNHQPTEEATSKNRDLKYEGLGGWLAYFMFGLFVSVGFSLYNSYGYLVETGAYGNYSNQMFGMGLLFAGLALGQITALYLMFKRKRLAVRTVIWVLILTIVIYSADAFVAQGIYDAIDTETPSDLYSNIGRTIILAPIWMIYFVRSKRVAATFTQDGLN